MANEVDLFPVEFFEHIGDIVLLSDIAFDEWRVAELSGEGLDAFFEGLALVRDSELSASLVACLSDAPSDRALIGESHNDAALAFEKVAFDKVGRHNGTIAYYNIGRKKYGKSEND